MLCGSFIGTNVSKERAFIVVRVDIDPEDRLTTFLRCCLSTRRHIPILTAMRTCLCPVFSDNNVTGRFYFGLSSKVPPNSEVT
jgi:hypothetical protein